jgi:hypothetical protein
LFPAYIFPGVSKRMHAVVSDAVCKNAGLDIRRLFGHVGVASVLPDPRPAYRRRLIANRLRCSSVSANISIARWVASKASD